MPASRVARATLSLSVVAAFSGCGFFGGKPALPKSAAVEASFESSPPDRLAAAIDNADIIYCTGGMTEATRHSIWRLLSALNHNDRPFAIGWEMLDLEQQPLLEAPDSATENASHLDWQVPPREREIYRELLARTLRPEVTHTALGCPKTLLLKVRRGEPLTAAETALIPHGFIAPPADYESFIEHLATTPGDRREEPAAIYRAHLISRQVVADKIVALARAQPDKKLVVVLRAENLNDPFGIPFFVKQKLHSRQLILEEKSGSASGHPPLLTLAAGRHEWLF